MIATVSHFLLVLFKKMEQVNYLEHFILVEYKNWVLSNAFDTDEEMIQEKDTFWDKWCDKNMEDGVWCDEHFVQLTALFLDIGKTTKKND